MEIRSTPLAGLFIITPSVIEDQRGWFTELYREDIFQHNGITAHFVQGNQSYSKAGVLRGLHFQWNHPLGKLIRVTSGCAFMVAVDIRKKSPTVGKWLGIEISLQNKKIIYAPPGFATGFCVLGEEMTGVEYLFTALYNPQGESNIYWNDPTLGIKWPIINPTLSMRDAQAETLQQWLARPESALLHYGSNA